MAWGPFTYMSKFFVAWIKQALSLTETLRGKPLLFTRLGSGQSQKATFFFLGIYFHMLLLGFCSYSYSTFFFKYCPSFHAQVEQEVKDVLACSYGLVLSFTISHGYCNVTTRRPHICIPANANELSRCWQLATHILH